MASDVAGCVDTAVAWVSALSVDAGLVVAALVVAGAGADRCYLNWPADFVDVGGPSFGTSARHGPDRNSVKNVAPGVLRARFDHRARIDALVLDADQFISAVDVDPALRFVQVSLAMFTIRIRISYRQAFRTTAGSCVVLYIANCILRARQLRDARTDAASAVAGQVSRAIVVSVALGSLAMHFRITEVAGSTATNCAMMFAVAFCVDCAFVLQNARVHALTIVAGCCVVALGVGFAIQFEAA